MPTPESTGWTVIRAAAAGSPSDREELARRYLGVIRAYLAARWRGSALLPKRYRSPAAAATIIAGIRTSQLASPAASRPGVIRTAHVECRTA